jgi:hypothetical protein
MTHGTCGFCGHYREPLQLWRDYYMATDGGLICEANLICEPCANKARGIDDALAERGLLVEEDV